MHVAAVPARPLRAQRVHVAVGVPAHRSSNCRVVSVEQFSYSEFLMSLPDPTAFYALGDRAVRRAGRASRSIPSRRVRDDRSHARRHRPAGAPSTGRSPKSNRTSWTRSSSCCSTAWPKPGSRSRPDVQHPRPRNAAADAAGRAPNEVVVRARVRPESRRCPRHVQSLHSDDVVEAAGAQFVAGLAAPAPRAHAAASARGSDENLVARARRRGDRSRRADRRANCSSWSPATC